MAAPARDPWFDNARWLAGSLVVVVHMSSDLLGADVQGPHLSAYWMHGLLWPMRVPLFALLVGYFSHISPTSKHYSNLVRMVIAPFVLVSALHVVLNVLGSHKLGFRPDQAQYTLWFLYGVIIWRASVPYLMRLRYPMAISIVIALASGAYPSLTGPWAMSRVLGYLPFFMAGVMLQQDDSWLRRHNDRLRSTAWKVMGFWALAVTVVLFSKVMTLNEIGMGVAYDDGLLATFAGMVRRSFVLVFGGAATIATLFLVPRRHLPLITTIGAGGFTIYLFHGLVIRLLDFVGVLDVFTTQPTWWSMPALIAMAFALAAVLGSTPVRDRLRPITQPRIAFLLKDDKAPATGASAKAATTAPTATTGLAMTERERELLGADRHPVGSR
ncbi:acyltransferase family protein [Actinomycetota bacterium]